jgi:hypothetical protein
MVSPFPVQPQSFHQALHLCIKPLHRIMYGAAGLRYITPHLAEWLFIIWLEHPIHGVLIFLLNNTSVICALCAAEQPENHLGCMDHHLHTATFGPNLNDEIGVTSESQGWKLDMKHPRPVEAEAAAQRCVLIIRLGLVPMFSAKLERYCSTLDTHTSGGCTAVPVLASSYWLGIWPHWSIMS